MKPAPSEGSVLRVRLELIDEGCIPRRLRQGDACMDLLSRIDLTVPPGGVVRIPVGFRLELPSGYRMDVRPRSSWGARGILVANSPGTVDAGYREEVVILLLNAGDEPLSIRRHDRVAQALIARNLDWDWEVVERIDPEGDRGGGLGSTGDY